VQFPLKDLELFVAVAEAGTIAKAAKCCHTVASAVSKRLSGLEDSFRTPLLSRSSKG
jgi:DNA-binding transcriptional LysR family regulator